MDTNQARSLLEGIIEDIETSRTYTTVCVPSRSYYSDRGEWSEETIYYVDSDTLLKLLRDRLAAMSNSTDSADK